MCGENGLRVCFYHRVRGSSPRVRGKPQQNTRPNRPTRLIPACAGKTQATHLRGLSSAAHPRVCGENKPGMIHAGVTKGSSPRVRGKLVHEARRRVAAGLIPACAGKTHSPSTPMCSTTAHPRVCGENPMAAARPILAPGSSPRVRGKPGMAGRRHRHARLIPACAGKTWRPPSRPSDSPAHPRVCGENTVTCPPAALIAGSSPRVRGKLFVASFTGDRGRLIPACAGKTPSLADTQPA